MAPPKLSPGLKRITKRTVQKKSRRKPVPTRGPLSPRRQKQLGGGYKRQPKAPKPTGVFRQPITPPKQNLQRSQQKARKRTTQAERRLPKDPRIQRVPAIKNPNKRQRQATLKAYDKTARSLGARSRPDLLLRLNRTPEGRQLVRQAGGAVKGNELAGDIARGKGIYTPPAINPNRLTVHERRELSDTGQIKVKPHSTAEAKYHFTEPKGVVKNRISEGVEMVTGIPIPAPTRRELAKAGRQARPAKTSLSANKDPAGVIESSLEGTGPIQQRLAQQQQAMGLGNSATGRALKNLIDLPVSVVPSLYMLAAGTLEASSGRGDRRLKGMVDEYAGKDGSGVLPQLARLNPKKAAENFAENPLYGALEFSGAYGAAGRGLGIAGRMGALGNVGRKMGSRTRDPLKIYGNIAEERLYSPNAFTKGFQVAGERRARKKGRDPNQHPDPTGENRVVPTFKPSPIQRQVDELADAEIEPIRRENRDIAQNEAVNLLLPPKRTRFSRKVKKEDRLRPSEQGVVSFAIQPIARRPETFKADLQNYRNRIAKKVEEEGHTWTPDEVESNTAQIAAIDKALDDPKLDPERVFRASDAYVERQNKVVGEIIERHGIPEAQARKAAAIPYAREHMGAGFDPRSRPSPAATRMRESHQELKQSQKEALRAERDLARAARHEAREEGKAQARGTARGRKQDAPGKVAVFDGENVKLTNGATLPETFVRTFGDGSTFGSVRMRHTAPATPRQRTQLKKMEEGLESAGWTRDGDTYVAPSLKITPREADRLIKVQANRMVAEKRHKQARAKADQARVAAREAFVPKDKRTVPPGATRSPHSRERLSLDEMEAAMLADRAGHPVGFVSQRPNMRGAGNWYRATQVGKRETLTGGKRRTGESTARGTGDSSPEAVVEQAISNQGKLDVIKAHDRVIEEFGLTRDDGEMFRDRDQADNAAAFLNEQYPGLDLVPVRAAPFHASKEDIKAIGEDLDIDTIDSLSGQMLDRWKQATMDDPKAPGPFVVMPRQVVSRFEEHLIRNLPAEKAFQAITQAFKTTVLPFSPKWVFGNFFDIFAVRSLAYGLHGEDHRVGTRFMEQMKKVDPEAAHRYRVRALGGTHLSSVDQTRLHRDLAQFQNSRVLPFAKALVGFGATPGVKQLKNLMMKLAQTSFTANRMMERSPQVAALGRQVRRDIRETNGKWSSALRASPEAIADVARGKTDTASIRSYHRGIQEVFGQWNANSPTARKVLTSYAPFYMWARAATKFVFLTLPTKHPVKTALLVAANEMTKEEREKLGLVAFMEGGVPGFLQGAIPGKDGGSIRFGGYSSFGYFTDFPANLPDMLLPQLSFLQPLAGYNFRNNKLKGKDGEDLKFPDTIALAAYSQMEALLPFIGHARRVMEKGGTSTDTSTIFSPEAKPGTEKNATQGFNKVFNPFYMMPANPNTPSGGGKIVKPKPGLGEWKAPSTSGTQLKGWK